MSSSPKLAVIRGGKHVARAERPESVRPVVEPGTAEHSAESESGVISLLDGWIRLLERQAASIKP